jgi:hypothetical protein
MRGIARLRGTAAPAEQPATGASATTPDAPAAP